MIITAKVKLLPTPEQASALREVLERVNAACNWVSGEAWTHKTFGQYNIHGLAYYAIRERFSLPSNLTVRLIAKVADAYKLDKKSKRTFRKDGAIDHDDRTLRWRLDRQEVSILTLGGRERIPFVCGPRQQELIASRQGQSSLTLVDGKFYLIACCLIETPVPQDVEDFLGVDLGIVNIATDSDGKVYSGAVVNSLRRRHRCLRQKLQAKGTKSARRLLKQRRRKEARFAADTNHVISKSIVATAQGTGRGIAIEELNGIRARVTARKPQRATLSSWAFAQLGAFLTYKARLAGVLLVRVDPRNTSRTCPSCGHIDKRNRKTQSLFSCVSCGFSGLADYIAADNIRRAATDQPYAAGLPA